MGSVCRRCRDFPDRLRRPRYSLFPYVVIDRLTIWEAASHPSALLFILVGTLIVVPLIIAYTAFSYRVFWGKVTGGDPYG